MGILLAVLLSFILKIKYVTICTLLTTWGITAFLFLSKSANGQDYIYRDKIINIFPNNFNREINCIDFDKQGFLWAGTNTGLFRYDGYNTDPYIFYNKDSFVNSPIIYDLLFSENCLYIATNQGLFVLETNKKNYNVYPIKELIRVPITKLYADENASIWCLTEIGIIACIKNKQCSKIQVGIRFEYNHTIVTETNKYLIVSFKNNKLLLIDKKKNNTEELVTLNNFEFATGLTKTPNKKIYISTDKGIFEIQLYDDAKAKLIPITEFGADVLSLNYISNRLFIYRTDGNIYDSYIKNGVLKTIKIPINVDNNLYIHGIKAKNNQFAIPGRSGLGVIDITPKNINTLIEINNLENGDSRGITEDSTYYYFCSYKNIFRQHKMSGKTEIISSQHLITHGIYRDNDTLWIASESNGLIRFNLKTFQTDKLFLNLSEKYQSTICVKALNSDTLIIGAYQCVLLYNKQTRKVVELKLKEKLHRLTTNGYFRDIHVLDKKTMIVATVEGVYKIELNGKIIKKYNNENSNCIWINNKKQIWVGTSNGLVLYDSTGKIIAKLTTDNGLAGNKIASIAPDHLGNVWVGTYTGLSCISTSDLAIRNYYKKDGLPDEEFNHGSIYVDQKRNLLMGTMKGFIQFKPSNIDVNIKSTASILISKIENQKNGILETKILPNNENMGLIKLGKEIKYSNIYFCSLPIAFFSEIKYSYKILKLITQDIDISQKPMITLLDSEPGKFDIEIEMNNGNGTNGLYNKIISYQIVQYFYLNKWFYIVVVLFFMLLTIGYLYMLIEQKNKNLSIRTEIARDLHDEIGGSLTAISLYTELLRDDSPPTQKQIKSIQNTTKKLLLSFRDALWTLNTQSDSAIELWDHLKDMVSDIAENLDIHIVFDEIDGLENIKFSLKTKQNLLLALKEGINNAIKHGDNSSLNIKWIILNEKHKIIISNSIKVSKTNNKFTVSSGIGIDSMIKRLNDIGGKITFESDNQFFNTTYHLNFIK